MKSCSLIRDIIFAITMLVIILWMNVIDHAAKQATKGQRQFNEEVIGSFRQVSGSVNTINRIMESHHRILKEFCENSLLLTRSNDTMIITITNREVER